MMPSNGARICRYWPSSLTAWVCACAALIEFSYERTSDCAASTVFCARITSFSATTARETTPTTSTPVCAAVGIAASTSAAVPSRTDRVMILAARGETPAAFGRRCIPADCVAPPLHMDDMLGRRALSAGGLAALGATLAFHHGLVTKLRLKPPSHRPAAGGESSLLGGRAAAATKTASKAETCLNRTDIGFRRCLARCVSERSV